MGKKKLKPPFIYLDVIIAYDFVGVAEECHWLWKVDGHKIFLPPIVRGYSTFDFQHKSIVRTMNKEISGYQDRVAFRRINRQGGRSTEMAAQVVGLYPSKYGMDMPAGEDASKRRPGEG